MLKVTRRVRIEWSHCDPAGIIFNPHYNVWMNNLVHQLLEAAGFPFHAAAGSAEFLGCPMVAVSLSFRTPARLNDVITHECQVARFGNRSFVVGHRFARDGETLAEGEDTRVWATGHPDDPKRMVAAAVPEAVKAGLSREAVVDVTP
jgi:4-hydroxybenzoyl-CoA thioesterase